LRPDKAPAQAVRVAVAPPTERVEGAMQTPDGRWRVEVVRRGNSRWYRIRHGDDLLDWLSIETVERLLAEAGVDRSTLVAVGEQPPAPARRMHSR
jgi:bifunctional non-homologous end joining protein LigD